MRDQKAKTSSQWQPRGTGRTPQAREAAEKPAVPSGGGAKANTSDFC